MSTPVGKEQLLSSKNEESRSHVMAEAILTGKEIEEFPCVDTPACLAFTQTVISKFPHHFFVCNRPGNGSNGKGDQKQIGNLLR
jgi:hypothetical protein